MHDHGSLCECGRCRVERRNRGTQALAIKIALRGGIFKKGVFVANWQPYCDDPVTIDRYITSRQAVDELKAMEVSMLAPCRKCKKCLQFRQLKWRERAIYEIGRANRTWWITLTFSPQHLAHVLMEAKTAEHKDIEPAAYRHVQRFLKRLRKYLWKHRDRILDEDGKETGANWAEFRYLGIYERGKKHGRSHYHLFLHETGTRPVLKELIERTWVSNVHARLVRSEDARRRASYVTSYATKSFDIRPRASSNYGKLR